MIDNYPAEMRPFIEAILANPQDDAPVLIFADWLEENGYETFAHCYREYTKQAKIAIVSRYAFSNKLPPQVPAAGV